MGSHLLIYREDMMHAKFLFTDRMKTYPETFEHLFLKRPEALSFGPLLLEPVLEDVNIDKAMKNEDKNDLLVVDSLFATIQDFEHDLACSSGHFNSNSPFESAHDVETSGEMTGQSNAKYATIISNSMSGGIYKPPKDLSYSFNRGFLGHDSFIPDSFSNSSWAVENQAFVILPDCHQDPLPKTLSLCVVSSEGFSEPSEQDKTFSEEDSPERSMFSSGMSSLKRSENNIFLTENSNVTCHFHTNAFVRGMRFPQDITCDLNPFISNCESPVKAFIPYVPQFQTLTIKLHETASSKA
ncbi:leptin receptor-like [Elgaria multicarinata webbii]|uniref:leptin receptor-like n=1 Tax=Elgaria multicarinata webbii TaxID=159646 RepID=UPI002FCCC815